MSPHRLPARCRARPALRRAALAVGSALGVALAVPPALAALRASGCARPIGLADTSAPAHVVGTGTPASCTGAALAAAVSSGGTIVFDCGPAPVTIPVTSTLVVTADTVIDGGGSVTLDGGGSTRILSVPSVFTFGTPTLTVQRLGLANGRGPDAGDDTERGGGAIWTLGGSVRVIDCSFTGNHATATGQDVAGGALYAVGVGTLTVVDSTFTGNGASNGGAIGALHADLALVDTAIADNEASGSGGNPGNGGNGGGVYVDGVDQTVSLCGVTVEGNRAHAFGGGLFRVSNDGVGPMAIDRTSVLSNSIPDADPSLAGGLYLQGVQIEMTASTVAGNQARAAGGLFVGPNGTTLHLVNSTIAENTALSGLAGGIAISDAVTGSIESSTLARNAAPGPLAFAGATTGGSGVVLRNSVVDGSVAGNGWNPISCNATFGEGGGNLQWPVARAGGGSDVPGALCSPSVLVADAQLGPLADHGGPTPTIQPAATSPAVGYGTGCPATDQRGATRNADSCTSGALEIPEPMGAAAAALAALAALAAASPRPR